MTRIGILYKVEELIKDKTPEKRYQERQKQSRPVVDALFEWLHSMEDSVDRSSLIGDAILYTLNQENYLRRYLDDGHLSIDNNSAERAIKNFAVGPPELAVCQEYPWCRCQCCCLQCHGNSFPERAETICVPDICAGPDTADGIISKAGRTGPAAPMVG